MIQSLTLEMVLFDFQAGQILAGQLRMSLNEVLLQPEGLHALVNKCFLADATMWQVHTLVYDR